MKILAVDMGRGKSVACDYESPSANHEFQTIGTTPAAFHDLIVDREPEVVVIEICPAAGWVRDLCESLGVRLLVANTCGEPWKWRKVKRKSDRDDALKLARLTAQNEIVSVHVPEKKVRQWRSLIQYRHQLVGDGTSIRNRIRAILDGVAIKLPAGRKAFSDAAVEVWRQDLFRKLGECDQEDLWRGMIEVEFQRLHELERHVAEVDKKLEEIAEADERVARVQEVRGVGVRTAELVVAMIDDPNRFTRGKQLGNYAGLTPKKYQSGSMDHDGRISRAGSGLLRALLVQASWSGVRAKVPWMLEVYERVRRGSVKRRKQAIVAVARRLWVRLWAMLRDGGRWRDPAAPVAAT